MSAPRVDFYVLAGDDPAARLRFACRLVEKAWLKRHRVRVQFESAGELDTFDQMLWTFSDRSFVPHRRAGADDATPAPAPSPVVIADTSESDSVDGDFMVNMGSAVPPGFEGFTRIAEIVDADANRRIRGRERFRFYRERGIEPKTHEIRSEP
ncbi:MAG: DNA polymerase III subunit chi [Steroidobacteraceae bacterium]